MISLIKDLPFMLFGNLGVEGEKRDRGKERE